VDSAASSPFDRDSCVRHSAGPLFQHVGPQACPLQSEQLHRNQVLGALAFTVSILMTFFYNKCGILVTKISGYVHIPIVLRLKIQIYEKTLEFKMFISPYLGKRLLALARVD
jgi:hypothetical protein